MKGDWERGKKPEHVEEIGSSMKKIETRLEQLECASKETGSA